MPEPRWITKAGLLILHEDSIREHGGSRGMRDDGLLVPATWRFNPSHELIFREEWLATGGEESERHADDAESGGGLAE